jgi:hypothetical protein
VAAAEGNLSRFIEFHPSFTLSFTVEPVQLDITGDITLSRRRMLVDFSRTNFHLSFDFEKPTQ